MRSRTMLIGAVTLLVSTTGAPAMVRALSGASPAFTRISKSPTIVSCESTTQRCRLDASQKLIPSKSWRIE